MDNKDLSEIEIIYDIKGEYIDIFGAKFVKNNINICKIVIDNKVNEIAEKYKVKNSKKNKIKS